MRAVVKRAPAPGLEMAEWPQPVPAPGECLVKVKAASICGTDLHIRNWDPWAAEHVRPPLVVGHEMCGEVVEHGPGVAEPPIGTYVSVESHIVCGRCRQCGAGLAHLCPATSILGVHRDGVFADYVRVPAVNLRPDPPGMPLAIACLQENFGNAVHTASTPRVRDKVVLVTGCGPVGIMAIAAVRAMGAARVLATDLSDYRLGLARSMGADVVLNPSRADVQAEIERITRSQGVDVLLEMSGAPAALEQGFGALAPGGEAALLGLFSKPLTFDLDDHVIFKGATVHGIVGRRLWETWDTMADLLHTGAVDLSPLVTHRLVLDDFETAFELMASGECGKVVMFPDPADADEPRQP
jgi:threonine 3-dehydrogenase